MRRDGDGWDGGMRIIEGIAKGPGFHPLRSIALADRLGNWGSLLECLPNTIRGRANPRWMVPL